MWYVTYPVDWKLSYFIFEFQTLMDLKKIIFRIVWSGVFSGQAWTQTFYIPDKEPDITFRRIKTVRMEFYADIMTNELSKTNIDFEWTYDTKKIWLYLRVHFRLLCNGEYSVPGWTLNFNKLRFYISWFYLRQVFKLMYFGQPLISRLSKSGFWLIRSAT